MMLGYLFRLADQRIREKSESVTLTIFRQLTAPDMGRMYNFIRYQDEIFA